MSNGAFPKLDTPFVQPSKSGEPAESGRIIAVPWYRLLITFWNRTGGQSGYVPGQNQPGMMSPFAGPIANVPSGYLLCDGMLYLASDYPTLFAAIGYTWGGAGDSFAVPNGTNRAAIGAGTHVLGTTGGSGTLTITQAMLPNYALTVTDPTHQHFEFFGEQIVASRTNITAATSVARQVNIGVGLDYDMSQPTIPANPANVGLSSLSATGISVALNGGGATAPILPPFFAANWIIKT